MKTLLTMAGLLLLAGCADNPRNDVAERVPARVCPAGYVESMPGSGYCEDPLQQQQQQQGLLRQTTGGMVDQTLAPVGGVRRRR